MGPGGAETARAPSPAPRGRPGSRTGVGAPRGAEAWRPEPSGPSRGGAGAAAAGTVNLNDSNLARLRR